MRSIIILVCYSYADTYRDINPHKIIKKDIDTLNKFDETIYNIADSAGDKNTISISKIYHFISEHRAMINDYSRLKVYAKGEIGSRTRRAIGELGDSYTLVDEVTNSREYYAVAVGVSYPIYDKKTEKQIRNERISQDSKILDYISSYAEAVAKVRSLKEELHIVQLIQIRDKSLVKTGIKYLDERIKTIERLHAVRQKIEIETINRSKLKQKLLTLTTDPIGLSKIL